MVLSPGHITSTCSGPSIVSPKISTPLSLNRLNWRLVIHSMMCGRSLIKAVLIQLQRSCKKTAINWKVIEMNLTQNTGVNFVERVNRSTRNMKVNYNEKALANCAFSMIPTFVVVTPPLSTSKATTLKASEKTKWLGLDNELTAQLFDDVEDDGDKHSTAELIDLIDSDDDLCDDESVSFSYDEFVTKDLWIDGQENACKTSPNHNNKWICASRLKFGTKGI